MTTPKVSITEAAERALVRLATESLPSETGGLLIGLLRDGQPWITVVKEVVDLSRSPVSFQIPAEVTPVIVERTRRRDPRLGYLGDWHSHPMNLGPSPTDRSTLNRDAKRPERGSSFPALSVLVRGTSSGWRLEAYVDGGAGVRPATLVLTGPMDPPISTPIKERG